MATTLTVAGVVPELGLALSQFPPEILDVQERPDCEAERLTACDAVGVPGS